MLREVSVKASCDPRSVAKYLDGKPLRSLVKNRIEAALRRLGLDEHVRAA